MILRCETLISPPCRLGHFSSPFTICAMDDFEIPVVDLSEWVGGAQGKEGDCQKLAETLHVSEIKYWARAMIPLLSPRTLPLIVCD